MVLSTILAAPRYVISGFYDEQGQFSAWRPLESTSQGPKRKEEQESSDMTAPGDNQQLDAYTTGSSRRRDSAGSTMSASSAGSANDEDELSRDMQTQEAQKPQPRTSRGLSDDSDQAGQERRRDDADAAGGSVEEVTPRRSTRIKIANPEGPRQRRTRRGPPEPLKSASGQLLATPESVKSPNAVSPARMTRYPRAPAPPRPLVPQRRPSYAPSNLPLFNPSHKTLILDLDETLIHSMAKGGRMGTGQMVEVRLKTSVAANGVIVGPQVPILYWVEKRPYCDEFLRKVCKWFNLIIFTASVQEYADPVIDILEQERKYFSGRYYRQHCTMRAGAYVKDLSQVEPDLSRVMILDNSPVSYIFHEDNAIPIEGWINDPEDCNLLHLLPLLEGLQHTTDVRALLALRLGEVTST